MFPEVLLIGQNFASVGDCLLALMGKISISFSDQSTFYVLGLFRQVGLMGKISVSSLITITILRAPAIPTRPNGKTFLNF